jgi:hypothetical protein
MASPIYRRPAPPPGVYRAARALRRAGVISLVLVIVFVAAVAYSAVQVVKTRPQVGQSAVAEEVNGTVGLTTSFTLANPGFFPIQGFGLAFRIANASGDLLVASVAGPVTIDAQTTEMLPIALYIPLTTSGTSLLTEDQSLRWDVWGNATYGYLFPLSVNVQTNRSWGAPFANLSVSVGAPEMQGGSEVVPITLTFSNDASFTDAGNLDFQVVPVSGPECAQGSFALDVPSHTPYSQTENVPFTTGCDPSGGHVGAQYVTPTYSVALPPEAIP